MVKSELRARGNYAPQSNQARLDHTRMVSYDRAMWSTAQTMVSTMMKYCRFDTITGQSQWYHEEGTREWTRKKPGIQRTPFKEQGFNRRLLETFVYDDAAVMDYDEEVESVANYFQSVASQRAHSLARLMDKTVFKAFLAPLVYEGAASPKAGETVGSATGTPAINDSLKHVTGLGHNTALRDVFFVQEQAADVSAQTDIFNGKDGIEGIRTIFRKRHLSGGTLNMTLTPNLQRILRQDPQFIDRENVYSGEKAANAGLNSGFSYRGINFVPVDEDQLFPLVANTDSVEAPGVGTLTASTIQISCRLLSETDASRLRGRYLTETADQAKLKTGKGAVAGAQAPTEDLQLQKTRMINGEKRHLVTTRTEDVAYVWTTSAIGNPLIFAKRDMLTMRKTAELPEWSFAKADYARQSFGALLRDEDYVMVVPIAASNVDIA